MRLFSLALRNISRNWHRTLVTTLAMAFAGFIMILFVALMEGLLKASERNALIMNTGEIQIHAPGYRDDPDLYNTMSTADELVGRLQQDGFNAAARLYGFGLAAARSTSAGVRLRGIDLDREIAVTQLYKHIMEGQWLDAEVPNGVVIGKKLGRTLGVKPNDEIIIVSQATDGSMANDLYTVQGILKSVGDEIDRTGFFMIDSTFRKLMLLPAGAHEIAIMRNNKKINLAAAKNQVERLAPDYEVADWRELLPVIARILDLADAQSIIMILITYVAVAMVVLNAVLMSVFERIHQFGVMKAIGVSPWQLIVLVYMETMIQVFVACVLALGSGWLAATHLQENGIDLSSIASGASFGGIALDPVWPAYVSFKGLFLPIALLILISLLAAVYPAIKAALIQPVKAIYYR